MSATGEKRASAIEETGTDAPRNGTMQAVLLDRYGTPEQFRLGRVPIPQPHARQVRIRVHAAGINPIDWRIRRGSLRWILPGRFPLILGFDVAGEIDALGPGVRSSEWQLGDRVFAYLDNRHGGGYAEYALANADVLAPVPANLTWEQAAGVPLACLTALLALRDVGRVQAGQRVLINGAAGGVGSFAVQLAAAWGARITGVCSGRNVDAVREWGADEVIDYERESFLATSEPYDVVFDAVSKSSYGACRRIFAAHGTYVATLPSLSTILFQLLTAFSRRRCRFILVRPSGSNLRYVADLIREGKIRPVIDGSFPMSEAPQAHRRSEEGHTRGKLVLRMPSLPGSK